MPSFFFYRWFFVGILVRLLVMPFFGHPDIFWINVGPSNLSEGILNIYKLHGDFQGTHLFKYPPLSYLLLGLNLIIFKPFLNSFFLACKIADYNLFQNWFDSSEIFQNLFFLKIHYLTADIIIIYLLFKITSKSSVIKYWALNPLILYSVYMYGQFDILAVAFIFIGFYMYSKNKNLTAFFCISIAGMLKHFPYLLLPIFFIESPVSILKRTGYLILSIIPYFIFCIPFLSSPSFRSDVIFNSSGYLNKYFISIYAFFLIVSAVNKIINKNKAASLKKIINKSFFVLATYLITSESISIFINKSSAFHPQFIIWLVPFFIFHISESPKMFKLYILLIFLFFLYINDWGRNATWLLLSPIDGEIALFPSVNAVISSILPVNIIMKIIKFFFSAVLIFWILTVFIAFSPRLKLK